MPTNADTPQNEHQTRKLSTIRVAVAVVVGRAVFSVDAPVLAKFAEVHYCQLVRVRDTQHSMWPQHRIRVVVYELAQMREAEILIILRVHQEFVPALVDSMWRCERFARDSAQIQIALGVGEQLAGIFIIHVKLALVPIDQLGMFVRHHAVQQRTALNGLVSFEAHLYFSLMGLKFQIPISRNSCRN